MAEPFALGRTKQCKSCPWKTSCVPARDIPFYEEEMHHELRSTIVEPGQIPEAGKPVHTMTCHYHDDSKPERCVGWLVNQLAAGNIALRLRMLDCTNLHEVQVDGPQHPTFDDTLPK